MGTECAHTSRVFRTRGRGSGPRWRNQTECDHLTFLELSGSGCSILCQQSGVHAPNNRAKAQLTGRPARARVAAGEG